MMMVTLQLAAGLVLLLLGGEFLVRGAVAVATRLGVSPFLIGLTLVGFGTSTPELVACLEAAMAGAPGIAIGNVVGSNIANILLILGIGAAIQRMQTNREAFLRDGPVLLAVSLLLAFACQLEVIGRVPGAIFLGLLLGYTIYTYRTERQQPDAAAAMHAAEVTLKQPGPASLVLALAIALGGLAGILLGARLLVDAAIEIARALDITEAVIGLTVVAVGTSLPELATTLVAAFRRQLDVAFGNIIGSNIFNVLGIVGVTALVRPLAVPPEVATFDVWVMLAVAGVAVLFAVTGWRVSRREGLCLLAGYVAYVTFLLA